MRSRGLWRLRQGTSFANVHLVASSGISRCCEPHSRGCLVARSNTPHRQPCHRHQKRLFLVGSQTESGDARVTNRPHSSPSLVCSGTASHCWRSTRTVAHHNHIGLGSKSSSASDCGNRGYSPLNLCLKAQGCARVLYHRRPYRRGLVDNVVTPPEWYRPVDSGRGVGSCESDRPHRGGFRIDRECPVYPGRRAARRTPRWPSTRRQSDPLQ